MEDPKTLQLDFGFEIKPIPKEKKKPISTKKAKNDFVFDFMDCLTSPVIVFKSAWQDAIPADVLNNITISRMICLMVGEQMASITEVVAYMMPRTFESPMHSEWINIYTWCGLQYAKSFKGVEQQKVMAEIAPQKLSDYEIHLLNDLRRWIYDKRRKALKLSMKSEKQVKLPDVTSKQGNLFGPHN